MPTKFNDANDMNTIASNAINSYIKDGYRIDAKESVIDREKDKDCTFKAVLKKDVDGIECKTVITLSDNEDDKNRHCTYHKVDTVGDTKWSEETHTFSSFNSKPVIKIINDGKEHEVKDLHDKTIKVINSSSHNEACKSCKTNDNTYDKSIKDTVKDTSASTSSKSNKDLCNSKFKINNKLEDCSTKSKNLSNDFESLFEDKISTSIDEYFDKVSCNQKTKFDNENDLEDSLIKLVRYIFGR